MATFHDFKVRDAKKNEFALSEYQGKVCLVVNVASQCGLTPQYKQLEDLYRQFKDRGLVVLGFPCNQFGSQEPGSEEEILSFCKAQYDVSFPIMAKVEVNGPGTAPVFQFLKEQSAEKTDIKWNFAKFLVDRNGRVLDRFAPQTSPSDLIPILEKTLN